MLNEYLIVYKELP